MVGRNPANTGGVHATPKERLKQLHHLENLALHVEGISIIFEGLIFTVVRHMPPGLRCRYRWLLFTLSLLAGSFNLCFQLTIANQYKNAVARGEERLDGEPNVGMCGRDWRGWDFFVSMALFCGFIAVTLAGIWEISCGC